MKFFAFAKSNFHLGNPIFEEEGNWYAGKTLFLNGLPESSDFDFMSKKLSLPFFFMIIGGAKTVGGYIAANEPEFVVVNRNVGLLDAATFVTERLNFCAREDNAGFKSFNNFVLKKSLSIGGKLFVLCLLIFLW